ncbi:MAG: hypothetical protein ACHQ1D_01595 [Nitrososphaerales archaeon]|jgi:hypothetical protein
MGLIIGLQKGIPFTIKCEDCNKELLIRPYKENASTGNEVDFPANIKLYIEGDKKMRVTLEKKSWENLKQ